MPSSLVIAANANKARLIGADRETRLKVMDLLSYFVDGYEQSDRFKSGGWDGKSSFYSFKTDVFPSGFVNSVEQMLRQEGHRVLLKRKRPGPPLGSSVDEAYAAVNPFGVDPKYSYQPETVRRLVKHGMMVAQIATGGGKSMIARTAVKHIMRPSIFLTTRQVLMYQMKEGFEEAGFKVGVLGDGEWTPRRGVNVGMIQTIGQRLINQELAEKTYKLMSIFELAILEEAHEVGSDSYFRVMNSLQNAYYRLALTATPFMKDDGEANKRLMAVSGQIGIRVSEKQLIDSGVLARPYFKYIKTPMPDTVLKGSSWQKAYDLGIVQNQRRNQIIVDEVKRAASYGLSSMILVQRKNHGAELKRLCKEAGLETEFIFGEHDQDQRKRALTRLKHGSLQVLIGSTILDVGVDVPAVGLVALAGGGKAEVALRQRIGRGLRSKKSGPNVCMVLDFEDGKNKHLIMHAKTRRAIVEGTPGFKEGILDFKADFPYAELGFSKL